MESLAFFVGPAIAAFLLAVADVASVFAVNALTFLLSAIIVSGIRPPKTADAPVPVTPAGEAVGTDAEELEKAAQEEVHFLKDALEGFRVIWRHPDLRLVVTTYCAQTVVAGAMGVFVVAIAFDMTDLGASGLGWLDSVLGIGAIFGGFLAIGLGARHRLASDFGWGVVFWAIPLMLVSIWPTAVAAFIAMAIIGAANPVVDVNASTILQRLTPDAVMGRVFGALESGLIGTMALGALVMPLLIAGPGLRWGLVILSVPIAVIALLGMPRMRTLDRTVSEPEGVSLLAGVPLFAPLARPLLESLAGKLTRIEVPAGTDVVRVGEAGRPLLRHRERPARGDVRRSRALVDGPRRVLRRDRAASRRPAHGHGDRAGGQRPAGAGPRGLPCRHVGRHRAARSHRVDGRPSDPDRLSAAQLLGRREGRRARHARRRGPWPR